MRDVAAVASGVALLWAGVQTLGGLAAALLFTAVRLGMIDEQALAAIVAVAAGYVLATAGTLRPSVLFRVFRSRHRITCYGVGGGVVGIVLALVWVAATITVPTSAVLIAAGSQPVLAAVWYRLADPPAAPAPLLHPHAVGNLVVALILVPPVAMTQLQIWDVYPHAVYRMYSVPRIDPYVLERVTFVGTDEDGLERQLQVVASRLALLRLVADEDVGSLEEIARDLLDEHDDVAEVTVVVEQVTVPPHPEPPSVEVVGQAEVVSVGR
jgi:hypothetical protein